MHETRPHTAHSGLVRLTRLHSSKRGFESSDVDRIGELSNLPGLRSPRLRLNGLARPPQMAVDAAVRELLHATLRAQAVHDARDVGKRSSGGRCVDDAMHAGAQVPDFDFRDAAVAKLVLHNTPYWRGV